MNNNHALSWFIAERVFKMHPKILRKVLDLPKETPLKELRKALLSKIEDVRCHYQAGGTAWYTKVEQDVDTVMYNSFEEFIKDMFYLDEGFVITLSTLPVTNDEYFEFEEF